MESEPCAAEMCPFFKVIGQIENLSRWSVVHFDRNLQKKLSYSWWCTVSNKYAFDIIFTFERIKYANSITVLNYSYNIMAWVFF